MRANNFVREEFDPAMRKSQTTIRAVPMAIQRVSDEVMTTLRRVGTSHGELLSKQVGSVDREQRVVTQGGCCCHSGSWAQIVSVGVLCQLLHPGWSLCVADPAMRQR